MIKVLLDKNLPVKLKYRLQDVCAIYTARDKGWNALENGDLIKAMEEDNFDYLITSDKNLRYQQNIEKYNIAFIILNVMNNNYETILPLVNEMKEVLLSEIKLKLTMIPA